MLNWQCIALALEVNLFCCFIFVSIFVSIQEAVVILENHLGSANKGIHRRVGLWPVCLQISHLGTPPCQLSIPSASQKSVEWTQDLVSGWGSNCGEDKPRCPPNPPPP